MEQLIYIEQRDKEEASKLSKGFAINETKNRAYINVLGSELAMKYLAQENISVSNTYNLHNIHKIREEFDVADVMLPNIHIDVRVVYDENLIFVPKAHFDYNITPNIYLVFNMAEDLSFVKFLGFFEPKLINKNNQNREYYFIEKEKLSHPSDLKNYIENFNGNTTTELSEDEIEEGQRLAISFIDNEISDNDKQKLLKMLLKSSQLRENLIEFDNFEVISYHTATTEDMDTTVLPAPTTVDEFEKFENTDDFADFSLEDLVEEDDGLNEETSKESEQEEDFTDNAEENAESVEDTDVKTIDEIPSEDLENFDGTEALDYTTDDINNLEKADNDDDINLVGEASLEDFPSETTEENISTTEDIKEDNTEESSGIAGEIAAGAVGLATAGTAAVAGADALGAGVDAISAEIAEETLSTAADVIEDVGEDHTKTEIIDDMSTDNITLPDLPMSTGLEDLESLDESDIVESDEATSSGDKLFDVLTDNSTEEDPLENGDLDEIDSLINSEEESLPEEKTSEEVMDETFDETDNTDGGYNIIDKDEGDTISFESLGATDFLDQIESSDDQETETTASFEELQTDTEAAVETPIAETPMAFENSTTITNQDVVPGEIAIDINQTASDESQDDLGVLYSNNENSQNNETIQTGKPEQGKKAVLVGTALAAVIAAGAIFGFTTMNKGNDEMAQNPITPATNPTEEITKTKHIEEQPIPEVQKPSVQSLDTTKTQTQQVTKPQKSVTTSTSPYLEVSKLNWAVPGYLSYNDDFKKYLQTAGKSLKLSISSDLLLATEYSYSEEIDVDIILSKEGSLTDAKILRSSGSNQIDGIVLQTVKETLNVVKAPAGVIDKDGTHLTLKIYL